MGGLAAPAATYPTRLVIGILKVLSKLLADTEDLNELAAHAAGPSPHEPGVDTEGYYIDDVHGTILEKDRVREARALEIQWCRKMGVWERVPRAVMEQEGQRAVTLRWIDTDKGDTLRPSYRSRLVAREIRKAMAEQLSTSETFSGMPPLEGLKCLLSLFVGHSVDMGTQRTLAFYDISRAHFHGVPLRRIFVELPDEELEELRASGDDTPYVGLLRKTMYGTVDASNRWQAHYRYIGSCLSGMGLELDPQIRHCSSTLLTPFVY
eukprot:6478084-Amphidinium_carterae.1